MEIMKVTGIAFVVLVILTIAFLVSHKTQMRARCNGRSDYDGFLGDLSVWTGTLTIIVGLVAGGTFAFYLAATSSTPADYQVYLSRYEHIVYELENDEYIKTEADRLALVERAERYNEDVLCGRDTASKFIIGLFWDDYWRIPEEDGGIPLIPHELIWNVKYRTLPETTEQKGE